MVKPLPLSAFIISLNEAKRIGQTLQSLQGLASEIIVIDSGSTDGTQEVAASYGATVIHNDWPGYGQQKRFAEEQCTHSWVLNLDADEVLSAELIQEIRQLFSPACTTDITHPACGGGRGGALATARTSQQPPLPIATRSPSPPQAGGIDPQSPDGYLLRICDCISGEARPRMFAHCTKAVRLYDKTKGRYADSLVHDRVQFTDPAAHIHTLSAPVYHYSVTSMEQVISKMNRYSTMQAEDMQARGKFPKHLGVRLFIEFPIAFFKSYILRGDILRGRKGFINSITYAFSRFARVAKAWEKQNSKK